MKITDYRLQVFPANYPLSGYLCTSLAIPLYSANEGIREFYLEMNNDVDTVYVNVEKRQTATAAGLYTYKEVRFNNRVVPYEYQPGVFAYVFRKQ